MTSPIVLNNNIPSVSLGTLMGVTISENPIIPPGTLVNVPQVFNYNTNIYPARRHGNQYYWTCVTNAITSTKAFEKLEIEGGIILHELTGRIWSIVLYKGEMFAVMTENLEIQAVL